MLETGIKAPEFTLKIRMEKRFRLRISVGKR